jgi:hypothetical protein
MNKLVLSAFVAGSLFGSFISMIVVGQLPKMQAKYDIGTCLSNGLYFEKVVDIKTSSVLREKKYVMETTINGRRSLPDVTLAWIVDDSYTVVNDRNCL